MAKIRCTTPFAVGHQVVFGGQILDASDPIAAGRDQFFEPVDRPRVESIAVVEQATAAPGEVRDVAPRVVKKATPAKKAAHKR